MQKAPAVAWMPQATPSALHPLLEALTDFPVHRGPRAGALTASFEHAPGSGRLAIRRAGPLRAHVTYDKPCHAARAVGLLLRGRGAPAAQTPVPPSLGIMLDCSRNAVMTVEHFTRWLQRLALLGYGTAMLYTEDTYEVPGEPAMGYLRGRYTEAELTRIDRAAAALGIEMVGCIQTLGHMEQVLRWPAYRDVRDTERVLLADEDATYRLIEKCVDVFARCYRSRRIHIGMDEAHDLGRGRFTDRFGQQRAWDIFNRHLARVIDICRRKGLEPLIWSDMYFRMGSATGDYYDTSCRVPPEVAAAIPKGVRLVYWDYYHTDAAFYADWIARHRALGFEPVMAGGVWTWSRLWYDRKATESATAPCLDACRRTGVKELLLTLWGDDGGYCEYDSAMAGLVYAAELAWTGKASPPAMRAALRALCVADYDAVLDASGLNEFGGANLLWDDPLLGIFWKSAQRDDARHWTGARRHFAALAGRLARRARGHAAGAGRSLSPDWGHAAALARCLLAKVEAGVRLQRAYAARDRRDLRAAAADAQAMVGRIESLLGTFRRQWMARNKPQGFEVIQIRLGGLRQRYIELANRVRELLTGAARSIPELDEPAPAGTVGRFWRGHASGSVIV